VEASLVPNPFRYVIKAEGAGHYELLITTSGLIVSPQGAGLGPGETYELGEGGGRLHATLRSREGAPRELSFNVRPRGAPVRLLGTRDGRGLRPADVALGREGFPPPAVPFTLPQLETEGEHERQGDLFAPAAGTRGLFVWLVLEQGKDVMTMDRETCERMKALGYIGSCAGL
jgi:hypothetical protein